MINHHLDLKVTHAEKILRHAKSILEKRSSLKDQVTAAELLCIAYIVEHNLEEQSYCLPSLICTVTIT